MELWEIRAEIPAGAAEETEIALLESGSGGWTLLEDAVAGRAWIVGIFRAGAEARSRVGLAAAGSVGGVVGGGGGGGVGGGWVPPPGGGGGGGGGVGGASPRS